MPLSYDPQFSEDLYSARQLLALPRENLDAISDLETALD